MIPKFDRTALIHVLIAASLIPIIVSGSFVVKLLSGFYAVWMLAKKSWAYMPALLILVSFLSNSYFLYLSIPIISLLDYKRLIRNNAFGLFLISLTVILPILFFSLNATFSSALPFGLNYARYEIVTSITALSFGSVLRDRLNRPILNVFLLAFLVLLFFQMVELLAFVRSVFFIYPFSLVYLVYTYTTRKSKQGFSRFLFAGMLFLFIGAYFTPSFTLILTAFHGLYIYHVVQKSNVTQFKYSTGSFMILGLTVLSLWAINNYRDADIGSKKVVGMDEVKSVGQLMERAYFKLLMDRAPLWAGALAQITEEPSFLPPKRIQKIQVERLDGEGNSDWDFHAHNAYLELLRTSGILIGGLTILLIVAGLVRARKGLEQSHYFPEELLLYSSSAGVLIIGSFTGIYVISANFSLLPLSVVGFVSSLPYRND